MSGLADLSQRHARLKEISGIMTAMKSLSLVEARKLARFIGDQRRMRDNIAAAAADFLQFYPGRITDHRTSGARVLVVIGSERGFCGNFNERIIQSIGDQPARSGTTSLIVVGHRLSARMADDFRVNARLDGPTVTEDVPAVLDRLLDALHDAAPASSPGVADLLCLAHDEHGEPVMTDLLPHSGAAGPVRPGEPPELLLAPAAFYSQLLEQFLLATLHGQLYGSLAAESHQRLAHMERALDRLDQTLQRLTLKRNALRQERIVEEIEVMLSSQMAQRNAR